MTTERKEERHYDDGGWKGKPPKPFNMDEIGALVRAYAGDGEGGKGKGIGGSGAAVARRTSCAFCGCFSHAHLLCAYATSMPAPSAFAPLVPPRLGSEKETAGDFTSLHQYVPCLNPYAQINVIDSKQHAAVISNS